MHRITQVFATVPTGRLVPIPTSEATAGGGALLTCAPGKVYVLPWTTYTRKRVKSGDLVLTNQGGTAVADPLAAIAPDTIKIAQDRTVDADQRTDDQINAAAAARTTTDAKSGKA